MEQLASAYAATPLLCWVLSSALIYALATNLLSAIQARDFWRSPSSRWVVQAGRFLFYVGIPYLALGGWPRRPYQGLLSLNDLGLVGLGLDASAPLSTSWPATRWLRSVGTGLGVGSIAALILAVAWANANRQAESRRLRLPRQPWWAVLVNALYLEMHWAFYRSALAVGLDDVYAGTFLGLGLVYLEWVLNPAWRRGWGLEFQGAGQWLRAALALVAALVFLLTRNLWVCLGVHGFAAMLFWQWDHTPVQAADAHHPQQPQRAT